jgi:hypothetical protein
VRDAAETQVSAVELFLNSVPILNPLSREEKLRLVDAFEQRSYTPGSEVRGARRGRGGGGRDAVGAAGRSGGRSRGRCRGGAERGLGVKGRAAARGRRTAGRGVGAAGISAICTAVLFWGRLLVCGSEQVLIIPWCAQVVVEGDPGDFFYIILDGEAVVYQNTLQVRPRRRGPGARAVPSDRRSSTAPEVFGHHFRGRETGAWATSGPGLSLASCALGPTLCPPVSPVLARPPRRSRGRAR